VGSGTARLLAIDAIAARCSFQDSPVHEYEPTFTWRATLAYADRTDQKRAMEGNTAMQCVSGRLPMKQGSSGRNAAGVYDDDAMRQEQLTHRFIGTRLRVDPAA
jgi:hypothetical protein